MSKVAPLGIHVASGFSWLLAQSIVTRLVTVLGQIVLAWYLGPREFGLMGLALTVSGFVGLLQQAGIREILVQRQASFNRWANSAFWMALLLGIVAAALMVASAPLVARLYGAEEIQGTNQLVQASAREQLVPMLYVMAVAIPINALAIVPLAQLQNGLLFRPLTLISLWQAIGTLVLSCIFAARGMGAFSFVLPLPIVAVVSTSLAWYCAQPSIRMCLQLNRWRYLAWDSLRLVMAGFLFQATLQGGTMVLGIFHYNDSTVGIYTFSFALSLQVTQLLTQNLGSVIFPVLSKLVGEPLRQRQAFFRAVRCLAIVGMPICVIQAATARPLLEVLFGSKWLEATEPLQVLCLGMGLQIANGPAIKFLLALGRTALVLMLSIGCAILFLSMVTIGAVLGGALSVSLAVAIYVVIIGQVCLIVPATLTGGQWHEALSVYFRPLLLSGLSVGVALLLSMALPASMAGNVGRIVVIVLVSLMLYVPLVRVWAGEEYHDLTLQVRRILGRFHAKGEP